MCRAMIETTHEHAQIEQLTDRLREHLGTLPIGPMRTLIIELLGFLESMRSVTQSLPSLQTDIEALRLQTATLTSPPLQYGVYLGPCEVSNGNGAPTQQHALSKMVEALIDRAWASATPSERERLTEMREQVLAALEELARPEVIVGVNGQRYEVRLTPSAPSISQLRQGQQVLLNAKLNVVAIREECGNGETAEVINVLSPPGAGRVLAVLEQGQRLRVEWSDGETVDLLCPEALRSEVRRGDIVRVNEQRSEAIGRTRPRLHVRSGGHDGFIADVSDRLFRDGVEIGDLVRLDGRLQFAYEKLPSHQTGGLVLEEVPDVSYDAIGGLDEQIEKIRDAIELPYVQRRLFEQYRLGRPKGILLYGPPGCGKTMIAKAVANSLTRSVRTHLERVEVMLVRYVESPSEEAAEELRLVGMAPEEAADQLRELRETGRDSVRTFFLNVKGPELLDKFVGETEQKIRKVFEEAKRHATFYTPVVIFFDEMEAMFRTRGSGRSSDVETTIVPQFLAEMDGVEAAENVVIIGASNRPEMIDPAILRPGRLDVKVRIDRPGREGARAILALHLTPDLPLNSQPARRERFHFAPHVARIGLESHARSMTKQDIQSILEGLPAGMDVRQALESGAFADKWRPIAEAAASAERLAEGLIERLIDVLFAPSNRLTALMISGKRYSFALSEFISGAVLASLVARAKRRAVKRRIERREETDGIGDEDLQHGMMEEFEENALQLANGRINGDLTGRGPGFVSDPVLNAEVRLAEVGDDPWACEKATPYKLG